MNEIEPVVKELPRVGEFYSGRSIFLTGFSGFLGKATVEKLLWTCPDIKAIYVLVRGKRGVSCQDRLNKILKSDCFDRVRSHRPEALKKVIGIEGDVLLPGLGMSEDDRSKIISEVSIIIHSAASVKFDDPLTFALNVNLAGTKSMLDLAIEIPQLEVFVYVSTAYTNCDKRNVEEKMYEPHANWVDMFKIREKVEESVINILSTKCCENLPNTYVFSKSLTEHMVYSYRQQIPVVIFRPSIVTSSYEDPQAGWVESLNGPIGICLGFSTGILRTFYLDQNCPLDYVPCDVIVRYLLWVTLLRPYQRNSDSLVYQATVKEKGLSHSVFQEHGFKCCDLYPIKYIIWKPNIHMTQNYTIFYIEFLLYMLLPAFLIDSILKLLGKETRFIKLQRKIFVSTSSLSHFTFNEFYLNNQKMFHLQKFVHPDDFDEFNFTFFASEDYDLNKYFHSCYLYMTKHFFKQTPDDYKMAKTRYNILTIADFVLKSIFGMLCAWLIYKHEVVQTLITGTINFIVNF